MGEVWLPVTHCDVLLCVSLTLQSALRSGQEAWILEADFRAVFDRVDHQGIFYKLCSASIGDNVLSILTQNLSNRSQHIMVDDCLSKLVKVVSGLPLSSVFGLLLFLLYTSEHFSIPESKLIGYADESILLYYVVLSPGVRVTRAESLNRDLDKVSEWCDLWEMKLNASKSKTMIVSR